MRKSLQTKITQDCDIEGRFSVHVLKRDANELVKLLGHVKSAISPEGRVRIPEDITTDDLEAIAASVVAQEETVDDDDKTKPLQLRRSPRKGSPSVGKGT